MLCPKCELGNIIAITIQRSNRPALLCDQCSTLWFAGEPIDSTTGHVASTLNEDMYEYTIAENSDEDQDHRPVNFVEWK
jgi:hypothetical protein